MLRASTIVGHVVVGHFIWLDIYFCWVGLCDRKICASLSSRVLVTCFESLCSLIPNWKTIITPSCELVAKSTSPSCCTTLLQLWSRSGSAEDRWLPAHLHVSNPLSGYSIVFEAIRDGNWDGDAAIDDVSFRDGFCPESNEACDFEQDLCNWVNDRNADYLWKRLNLGTCCFVSISVLPWLAALQRSQRIFQHVCAVTCMSGHLQIQILRERTRFYLVIWVISSPEMRWRFLQGCGADSFLINSAFHRTCRKP